MVRALEPLGQGAMSFSRPELLGLVLLAPVLAVLAVGAYARRRRRVARLLADSELLDRLGGAGLDRFPRLRLVLIGSAAALLGFAMSGPRWGLREIAGRSTGRSVVLALDVSKSMLAEDTRPNRLERERLFVRRLLREMPGDRIGLVVFAGRAYVLSPMTVDQGALNLYIDALDPGVVSQGGSSLASAIEQATDLARGPSETGGDRAVILVSDGEALEELATVRDAADRAARSGVRFFTVGVGTAEGATIPELDATDRPIGLKEDENGKVVISKLDADLLRDVSRRTAGRYFELDQAGSTAMLLSALGGMAQSENEPGTRFEPKDRAGLFIGVALLLLLLDQLIEQRSIIVSSSQRRDRRFPPAARAAALLAVLILTSGAGPGDVERGNRHYRAGRYKEAVEAYEAALRDGNDSRELRYNLGTALLRLGKYDEAEQQFHDALEAVDPDLRERTFYNLGNRFLDAALGEGDGQAKGPLLDAAAEAYRRALRIDSQDPAAKWNLEMSLREQEQNQQPSQGGNQNPQGNPKPQDQQQDGQGGSGGSSTDQPQPEPRPGDSDRVPLTREQADRVLSAVEQDERDLTREKLRKGQRRTPVRRDW